MNAGGDARAPLASELFAAHVRYLRSLPMDWAARRVELLQQGQKSGWLGTLLRELRPGTFAWSLADRAAHRGIRVHALQLTKQEPELLAELVDALDEIGPTPAYAFSDLIEGVGFEQQRSVFTPRGFSLRSPVKMELPSRVPLPPAPSGAPFRPFVPGDRRAFVNLYARVYDEPQGDWSLYPSPGVEADARLFIDHFLTQEGAFAPNLIPAGTLLCEIAGRAVASILVERWSADELNVANLMVDPEFQRRGLGEALLLESLHRVRGEAKGRVMLGVVQGSAAHRLYRSVGFQEIPPPEGLLPTYWVRTRPV